MFVRSAFMSSSATGIYNNRGEDVSWQQQQRSRQLSTRFAMVQNIRGTEDVTDELVPLRTHCESCRESHCHWTIPSIRSNDYQYYQPFSKVSEFDESN